MNVALRAWNGIELCAGVGMLGEGIRAGREYLGIDYQTLCYVERDAYAAATLVARMEDKALAPALVWDDLESFDGRAWRGRVHIVSAGFPCQPWSVAGAQRGTGDDRWLWPALFRIIVDVEPAIVFLENVPGPVSGGGLEYVLSDLAKARFDAQWASLTAAAVGAPHKRERVFILAYMADAGRLSCAGRRDARDVAGETGTLEGNGEQRERLRDTLGDGVPTVQLADSDIAGLRASGIGQCGPLHAEQRDEELADAARGGLGIVRQPPGSDGQPDGSGGDVGDSPRRTPTNGQQQHAECEPTEGRGIMGDTQRDGRRECGPGRRESGRGDLFPPGPGDRDGWRRVLAESQWLAPAISTEEAKSLFRRVANGDATVLDDAASIDAYRADRLRCAGNSVVPLQAAVAFVHLAIRAGLV